MAAFKLISALIQEVTSRIFPTIMGWPDSSLSPVGQKQAVLVQLFCPCDCASVQRTAGLKDVPWWSKVLASPFLSPSPWHPPDIFLMKPAVPFPPIMTQARLLARPCKTKGLGGEGAQINTCNYRLDHPEEESMCVCVGGGSADSVQSPSKLHSPIHHRVPMAAAEAGPVLPMQREALRSSSWHQKGGGREPSVPAPTRPPPLLP